MKVLIVEDEEIIQNVIEAYAKASGYQVSVVDSFDMAIQALNSETFDIAILDIMLVGDKTGLDILSYIRENKIELPVIMLSALSDEKTQIEAFDGLADDYVTKPFSPKLLMKRVEVVIRRFKSQTATLMRQESNREKKLVEEVYQFFYEGKSLGLTLTEFMLLSVMYRHPKQIFTRDHLLEIIYKDDVFPSDRIIDAHIKNIRKKLPIDCITTVKGIGYKYEEVSE